MLRNNLTWLKDLNTFTICSKLEFGDGIVLHNLTVCQNVCDNNIIYTIIQEWLFTSIKIFIYTSQKITSVKRLPDKCAVKTIHWKKIDRKTSHFKKKFHKDFKNLRMQFFLAIKELRLLITSGCQNCTGWDWKLHTNGGTHSIHKHV